MKAGELVINIITKGDGDAAKKLTRTKDGLKDVKSLGLGAKAAILGTIYALQRMMGASAANGTALSNFNALTGMSTQQLQRWQYAARQAGVGAEEMAGALKGVQDNVANMLMGKGAPEGFAMVANKVGLDPKKLRDTEYVLKQLQKFAKAVPQDIGNQMLKSFGLSEGVIAAMRKNAFNDKAFKRAPVYSDGQVKNLSKVDAAWANLGNKIEMAFGKITSKHGLKIVSDLNNLTNSVIKLAEAFVVLAENTKFLQLIGMSVEGWAHVFNGAAGMAKEMSGSQLLDPKKAMSAPKGRFRTITQGPLAGTMQWENDVAPAMKSRPSGNKTINNNVNQNLNFQHDGKDHKKTGKSVEKAVREGFRQLPSQAQES